MQLQDLFDSCKGEVKEVVVGAAGKTVVLGGEKTLPFHTFEGQGGAPVRFALEIFDTAPEGWPDHLQSLYPRGAYDPLSWAKEAVDTYGADLVCLYLAGIDSDDFSPEKIAQRVKYVADGLSVPLVVTGVGDKDRDAKTLTEVARLCKGAGLLLGPLVKENYEEIGRVALETGHGIVAQSPLDINICKEMNVKLTKFFPRERIVIDPLSAAVGYGIDYSFSIMERVKQVAVIHNDEMMKMPIVANIGRDCWKTKEAREDRNQGVLWEALTAFTLVLAGANLVILRHPESMKLVKKMTEGKE